MQTPIPEAWRQAVCRILSSGSFGKEIIIRQRALQEWQAMFPLKTFVTELADAFHDALKDPKLVGRQVLGMSEPGTVYEFLFKHENRLVYGKINLQPDGKIIIIYSAHHPLKGDFL
jgi:hypothetical protein